MIDFGFVSGILLVIIGLYIYFKPKESAEKIGIRLKNNTPHIKNGVGAGEVVFRKHHFYAPTSQSVQEESS